MATDYRQVLQEMRDEEKRLESELGIIRTTIPGIEILAKRMPVPATQVLAAPTWTSAPTAATSEKPYAAMGAKEAILHNLNSQLLPQMPAAIAKALLDGGVQTRSNDFAGMIGSTLTQMKADGLIERVEDGWKIKSN